MKLNVKRPQKIDDILLGKIAGGRDLVLPLDSTLKKSKIIDLKQNLDEDQENKKKTE